MPALRPHDVDRVRARLDPIALPGHGEWRHPPAPPRPSASTILREGERGPRTSTSRCSTSRRTAARARPTAGGVMRCNATSGNMIVCGCGQLLQPLTMLPYLTLATTLGLLLQREEVELELLLARAPRAAHVQRDRSIDRENQGEERRKTCLSCCSHASFTPTTLRDVHAPPLLREVEHLELDVRGLRFPLRRICLSWAERGSEDGATRHA